MEGLYRVASVVTLVDAVNWEGTAGDHDEWTRQVALADQIRIGKLDLVGGDRVAAESNLSAELRRLNPAAEIGLVEQDWRLP